MVEKDSYNNYGLCGVLRIRTASFQTPPLKTRRCTQHASTVYGCFAVSLSLSGDLCHYHFFSLSLSLCLYYIYVYIYMCVCVCMSIYIYVCMYVYYMYILTKTHEQIYIEVLE